MKLFGQRLDEVDYQDVLRLVADSVKGRRKKISIFSLNLHTFRLLFDDVSFMKIHKKAGIVHADGMMIVYLARFFGKKITRVNGTELVLKILERDYKCFVIGLNKKLFDQLHGKYPNVLGFYNPSYSKIWSDKETEKMLTKIDKLGVEVVLVGVSNPKAERWIDKNNKKTMANVWMAVGSAPEILAGGKKRAPKLLQNMGLEWLWRLGLEPRRLWKRYVSDACWLGRFLIGRKV